MAKHRPVLIAGGGIGGLSAAIALGRAGFDSTILERSKFTEESGAGIQLGPNATRLLARLGVLDALLPSAFTPDAVCLFDGISGRTLTTVPLGAQAENRYGAPYLTLHRADLHAGLRTVADSLDAVTLRPGFDVAGIEAGDETVTLAKIDGTPVGGSALIGADGLWSTARKTVAPHARLHFSGHTAYRALLPLSGLPSPFDAPRVGLWLGPKAHLVHYPVRGGEALNIVAIIEGGGEAQGWNRAGDRDALLSGFTDWCKDSKSLLERVGGWRAWSLYRLDPLASWSRGPVTLLGDAAHPVLPYLAQGAALAIEDAAVLAKALAAQPRDPASAFVRYEALRRQRTIRLQRASRQFGWIYHLRGPARVARNLVLARRNEQTALEQFDWLYGETAL
jgi:3-hydroxybenzoate 6-monooxygenase